MDAAGEENDRGASITLGDVKTALEQALGGTHADQGKIDAALNALFPDKGDLNAQVRTNSLPGTPGTPGTSTTAP